MCASVHEQGAIRACCQAEHSMGQHDCDCGASYTASLSLLFFLFTELWRSRPVAEGIPARFLSFFWPRPPKTVKEVREGGWKREWLAMRLFPGLSARFGLGILEARAECPREAFLHRLVEESLCQYLGGQSACAWAGSER